MATAKQKLGEFGEKIVSKHWICPRCKKDTSLKILPANFKCADVICDFCGYLGQVKTKSVRDIEKVPSTILGAAWGPQSERMAAGIYFPLFIVLVAKKASSIFYLSADLQAPEMFVARKPLSESARQAGWQGFYYDMNALPKGAVIRIR